MGIYQLRYGAFSLSQSQTVNALVDVFTVTLFQFSVLSHKRASNYITDNQCFSLFIDGNTAVHNILIFK